MTPRRRDDRFHSLTELAKAGNVEAAADLFKEYGVTPNELPMTEDENDRNHNQKEER